MAHERHTAAFVVGLALGGLAGAGYVLFKTPRSGSDVRAGIAARIQGIAGAVKETAGVVGVETRRAGEQTVERIEATGAAVRDRLPGAGGVADLVPGGATPALDETPTVAAAAPLIEDGLPGGADSDQGRDLASLVDSQDETVTDFSATPPAPSFAADVNGVIDAPRIGDEAQRAAGSRAAPDDATRTSG